MVNPPLPPSPPIPPIPTPPLPPPPGPVPPTPNPPTPPAGAEMPAEVIALLQSRCSQCHTYGERDTAGWGSVLDLSRMIAADIVVPGNPESSRLFQRIAWFSGSADAIYQNLNLIYDESPDLVCVFGADHIYRMDPRQLIDHHLEVGAGVTVAAIPVPIPDARDFGVIESADDGRIIAFHEKVQDPPTMPGDDTRRLASMGNYVFDTQTLIDVVTPVEATYTDLGGHVIPALTALGVAHVYDFSKNIVPGQDDRERGPLACNVGTLDSYFSANMDLIAPLPAFNLYNDELPVYTYRDAEPPAKVSRGPGWEPSYVDGSLLCQGSIVSGAHVERSIISNGCYVLNDAHVTDSILFPGVRIGAGARLHRCIIDKNVNVPPGYRIGHDPDIDREHFTVSESGITVIWKIRKLSGD